MIDKRKYFHMDKASLRNECCYLADVVMGGESHIEKMEKVWDHKDARLRQALGPHNDDAEPVVMLVAGLVAEMERLRGSLPHTADGEPIVPGMTVHCLNGDHVDERKVIGPVGKVALYTFEPARHGCGNGQSHRLAETVYASRENAKEPTT